MDYPKEYYEELAKDCGGDLRKLYMQEYPDVIEPMSNAEAYEMLKAARAGTPGYDDKGEVVYMPVGDEYQPYIVDPAYGVSRDALDALNAAYGKGPVAVVGGNTVQSIDKTQELLHRMASVQIEASVRNMVDNLMMVDRAKALNDAGVTYLGMQLQTGRGEVSYAALCASWGHPPAAPTVH